MTRYRIIKIKNYKWVELQVQKEGLMHWETVDVFANVDEAKKTLNTEVERHKFSIIKTKTVYTTKEKIENAVLFLILTPCIVIIARIVTTYLTTNK